MDLGQLSSAFQERFGARPRLFSAPGRVNLIGEHTDYNDGFVLPLAIERRTFVAAAPRSDRRVVAQSLNLAGETSFDLDRPGPARQGAWGDYIEGTARALLSRGFELSGVNLLIQSQVPSGAGLSASAALELSVGYALSVLGGCANPDRVALALAGQQAEHEYVGTLCGIMDQYISALGVSGHALLIDCRSLETRAVPLVLGDARIVICDTKVKHQLASSEYNQRREECQAAVAALSGALPQIRALRDVSSAELEAHAARLSQVQLRRARHVVTENARTLEAVEALGAGDLSRVGKLMLASHRSLQNDYEVSCPELDVAVDAALSVSGVYGSRMTGGGFGGCTVSLVDASAIFDMTECVRGRFRRAFGSEPELFASLAAGGAQAHEDDAKGG
jgi:galactokinase